MHALFVLVDKKKNNGRITIPFAVITFSRHL